MPRLTSSQRDGGLGHGQHDEVREAQPVRVQVAGRDARILVPADDDHRPIRRDRRQRGAASVEDDDVRLELDRQPRALDDVRGRDASCEPAAAAPAPDRRDADQRGRLEMVGGRVTPRPRELDERVDGRTAR